MKDLYSTDDQVDCFSRDSLDNFIKDKREISDKKQFVKYYWRFCRRVQGLKEDILYSPKV